MGADMSGVLLNARQKIEGGPRAGRVALCLQAHAHDAIEYQGEEADEGMGANAVGQAMVNGRAFDVGFEDSEAALDICQGLVAPHRLGRGEVGRICQQGQLAVEQLGRGNGLLVQ